MKNRLERQIVNSVYKLETRNTSVHLFLQIIFAFWIFFGLFIVALVLIEYIQEQNTFNFIELIHEDWDVFIQNISGIREIIMYEIPSQIAWLFAGLCTVAVVLVVTFIKNFVSIRNKLLALVNYWMHY